MAQLDQLAQDVVIAWEKGLLKEQSHEARQAMVKLAVKVGRGWLCPKCGQDRRDRSDEAKCCNEDCGGVWGTGCYCCHHH